MTSRRAVSSTLLVLGSATATFTLLGQLPQAKARSEQLTSLRDGVGPVVRRKVWAEVRGSVHSAPEVIDTLLQHFPEYMPSLLSWVFRRRPPQSRVREGEKLDIRLFLLRVGKVQVSDITPLSFTIRTLCQHPDAGLVKVSARPVSSTHFELDIESVVRSSNGFDRAVYRSGIKWLQHSNWEIVLSRALEYAGGQVVQRDALVEEYPYRDTSTDQVTAKNTTPG